MKRFFKNSPFLLLILCCMVQLNAQQSKDLRRDGVIKNIHFEKNQQPTVKEAKTILRQKLEMNDSDRFILLKDTNDDLGFSHQIHQQYHKGIKVEFGTYLIHSKNNRVQTMNGDFFPLKGINTNPTISEEQALSFALASINAESYMWESAENEKYAARNEAAGTYKPQGELVVIKQYYARDKTPDLAYKFDIYAETPLSRDHVYVNAHTGEISFKNAIIKHCFHSAGKHTSTCAAHDHGHASEAVAKVARTVSDFFASGTAATRYSGSRTIETSTTSGGYHLRDATRGNGINTYDCNKSTSYSLAVDFLDNDNNWTFGEWNNEQKDDAALDAHWGAEMTYDYFVQQHNRNSYDGNGAAINNFIHYNRNYDNAFWDGSKMTYGDGNSFDALTSLDVTAHEIGHGVCTHTANLVYSYESGALNEAFSDIWAACVEGLMAPGEKQPFLIGEDIGPNGTPLRNMMNPNEQNQPDTYLGDFWYNGGGDYGGVHYNSGVLNHCFYILSEGKSGTNDNGDDYAVPGIGIVKSGKIFYRAESVYLSANSQYADARTACIQSAIDLYGAYSDEVCQTTNAFYATGVGAANACSAAPCTDNEVTITIIFDSYPEETSWTLKSADNTTVASGGTYGAEADGSTITITECLPDGCYDFTITDVYGDGICCGYGNGFYTITSGGATLASGGSFGAFETTNICISGTASTCTDGIQNGDETAVDCGGPKCDPCQISGCTDASAHNYDPNATTDNGTCETCNDGILNGDETGMDCGGANCAPCCENVNITINFDNYPQETSWTIKSGTTIVAEGGTYDNQADRSTLTVTECLPAGCYDFTINDVYGDGICCGYGNGFYTVTNDGGDVLVSGGSFGAFESTNICLTSAVASAVARGIPNTNETTELKDAVANEINIFPNPTKDILNVSLTADSKEISIKVYNQLGQLIMTRNMEDGTKTTQLPVADLIPGNYIINVTLDGERTVQKFIKY